MSSPNPFPMIPRTSAALPALILALGALAVPSFPAGAESKTAASKSPPAFGASSGAASDDSSALLRELIRTGSPRVKEVKDERGRVIRIEFSRRGGTSPNEIITFPAAGITQRERDDDGDGFFEERRIERRDIDVLIERRAGRDATWRTFEKRTFHRSEGLVRIQTYDASGIQILSTRTEPLWREESYADAYARCISGASPQEDACSVSPHPLGNRLPDPWSAAGQNTAEEHDLVTALAGMHGDACTADPQTLYTGTGFLIDRASCSNDPKLLEQVRTSVERGTAGLMQCFNPNSAGRPASLGRIHFPSTELSATLAMTFYDLVEVGGGIVLECSTPGARSSIAAGAAADATHHLRRIRFNELTLRSPNSSMILDQVGGHEFLHLTQVLGDEGAIDNQDTASHNATHGVDSIDLTEKDRIYACAALCLGSTIPTSRACGLCLDRDPAAARENCANLPSSGDLEQLRYAIPGSVYIEGDCDAPEADALSLKTFQEWKACIDGVRSSLEKTIDTYAARPYSDPRWREEITLSRRELASSAANRAGLPLCSALKKISPSAVACRLRADPAACRSLQANFGSNPGLKVRMAELEAIVAKSSLLTRTLLKKNCDAR